MTAPIKLKRTYFAVADLAYDDVNIVVLTPGGEECVARRRTIWRRREASVVWRMRIPVREPGRPIRYRYQDLPGHLVITRWRPLDRAAFPGPLPAPAGSRATSPGSRSPIHRRRRSRPMRSTGRANTTPRPTSRCARPRSGCCVGCARTAPEAIAPQLRPPAAFAIPLCYCCARPSAGLRPSR